MEKIKISILIATFNSEKTIRLALDSVAKLDIEEWECIIIDGASKDSTIDIVKQYASQDGRFRFISESDKGIYDALNKGCNLAKGEWIYVLGSDDTVTTNGLKDLLDGSDGFDVVYGNVYIKDPTGCVRTFKAKKTKAITYVMICSHQAVIVRREVMNRLRGFNLAYKIRADFDIIQRAYLAGFKFKYVDTFVAYFMGTGLSSTASINTHIERYHVCKNNKSKPFPLFWYCYQESKYLLRHFVLKKTKK